MKSLKEEIQDTISTIRRTTNLIGSNEELLVNMYKNSEDFKYLGQLIYASFLRKEVSELTENDIKYILLNYKD